MCEGLSLVAMCEGRRVEKANCVWQTHIDAGVRTILLPALSATAFKEAHDSIWAGHFRGTQTYKRVARQFWWPKMRDAV
ncbi:hypothetical protein PybrP1_002614 [[Pythium] brassicae (nom. inval.)]|nr:hypothetical protein PybrP1_002614 [[Pythium] brassicae (nom. inval.)]